MEKKDSMEILSEWLVTDLRGKPVLKGVSGTIRTLGKIWKKCQNKLVPAHSSLITFASHPEFGQIKQRIDFNLWCQQVFL